MKGMDKNTVIGLTLIFGVFVVYSIINQPSPEELQRQREREKTTEQVQEPEKDPRETNKTNERRKGKETADEESYSPEDRQERERSGRTTERESRDREMARKDTLPKSTAKERREKYGIFAPAAKGKDRRITLENDRIKVTLSQKGGRVTSVRLKNYQTYDSQPLYLFKGDSSGYGLRFNYNEERFLSTEDLYFTALDSSMSVEDRQGPGKVRFRLKTSDPDKYIQFNYSLEDGSYKLNHSVNVVGLGEEVRRDMELNWRMASPGKEKNRQYEKRRSTLCYKYVNNNEVEWLTWFSADSDGEAQLTAQVDWVAFKQQFFNAIIGSERGFDYKGANVLVKSLKADKYTKYYETNLSLPLANTEHASYPLYFYFGPSHYQTLASYDKNYEDTINLGWGIFSWVNKYLIIPIFNFLESYQLSYGIIILILTLIIKTILLPLTYKSYKSSAKMKVLKPEIDELNKKYENEQDPMKKQQAVMNLYKQAGVNPMAGCVPMLIQLPILIAMYRFFPASIELRQESFLWADDLSTYDSILELPFSIPFYGDHVSLFTLLMFLSTMLYTRLNSDQMGGGGGSAQMPQMKVMMYIFPIMILFIFNSFSAALSYYYFSANVISMLQMLMIKKLVIDEDAIHKQLQENKKKPAKAKKSNFQKRMEEMAKKKGYKPPK